MYVSVIICSFVISRATNYYLILMKNQDIFLCQSLVKNSPGSIHINSNLLEKNVFIVKRLLIPNK